MDQHKYYLDASIDNYFEVTFQRAQYFAARALERLDDPRDSEFREVFWRIFKTPVTDTTPMARSPQFRPTSARNYFDWQQQQQWCSVLAHVRRELSSFVSGWTRTFDRAEAEVRIHADGIGRYWQLSPETFFDPVNYMIRPRGMPSTEEVFREAYASVMYVRPEDPDLNWVWADQHLHRNVIDFTEVAREKQSSWETFVGNSLAGSHVDFLVKGSLENTLIHEMMHCEAYKLVDFRDKHGATYGWNLLLGLTKQQSYICAESIAMLCLAAALADLEPVDLPRGYRYTISSDGKIIGYRNIFRDWTPA